MSAPATVTLGEREIPCYAQRHARLAHGLQDSMAAIIAGSQGLGVETLFSYAGESVYHLLDALNPNIGKRIPLHEFMGYQSAAAYEAGDYDPDLDMAPSIPEIRAALDTCFKVNGLDGLKRLSGFLVDGETLKALATRKLIQAAQQADESPTLSSLNTPAPSPSTTSTTQVPITTANTD